MPLSMAGRRLRVSNPLGQSQVFDWNADSDPTQEELAQIALNNDLGPVQPPAQLQTPEIPAQAPVAPPTPQPQPEPELTPRVSSFFQPEAEPPQEQAPVQAPVQQPSPIQSRFAGQSLIGSQLPSLDPNIAYQQNLRDYQSARHPEGRALQVMRPPEAPMHTTDRLGLTENDNPEDIVRKVEEQKKPLVDFANLPIFPKKPSEGIDFKPGEKQFETPEEHLKANPDDFVANLVKGVADFSSGMTTRENLAFLFAGGAPLARPAKALVNAIFTGQMGMGAFHSGKELVDAYQKGDWNRFAQTLPSFGGELYFATHAGKGALEAVRGPREAGPVSEPREARAAEARPEIEVPQESFAASETGTFTPGDLGRKVRDIITRKSKGPVEEGPGEAAPVLERRVGEVKAPEALETPPDIPVKSPELPFYMTEAAGPEMHPLENRNRREVANRAIQAIKANYSSDAFWSDPDVVLDTVSKIPGVTKQRKGFSDSTKQLIKDELGDFWKNEAGTMDPERIKELAQKFSPVYSPITRFIRENFQGKSVNPLDLANRMEAKLPKDALEDSGVLERLRSREGNITRKEALELGKGEGTRFKETVLPTSAPKLEFKQENIHGREVWTPQDTKIVSEIIKVKSPFASKGDEYQLHFDDGSLFYFDSVKEAQEFAQKQVDQRLGRGTQYPNPGYRTPRGENYREVLLQLDRPKLKELRGKIQELENEKLRVNADLLEMDRDMGRAAVNDPNYVKKEDRYSAINKELRELGDQLHGERRKQFKESHWSEPDVYAHLRMQDFKGDVGEKILSLEESQSDWAQKQRKHEKEAEAQRKLGNEPEKLPFEPSPRANTQHWSSDVIKRALYEAAKGNYDKLVWPRGEDIHERFGDLGQQFSRILYDPNTETLRATRHSGGIDTFHIPKEALPDNIGEELAEKLLAKPPEQKFGMHVLEGDEVKTTGKGHQKYYNEMFPSLVDKYLKQFGVKTGSTKLSAKGKYFVEEVPDPWSYEDSGGKAWEVVNQGTGERSHTFYDEEAAADYAKRQSREYMMHSIDMTPELQERILHGQPKHGATLDKLTEKGKEALSPEEKADRSISNFLKSEEGTFTPKEMMEEVKDKWTKARTSARVVFRLADRALEGDKRFGKFVTGLKNAHFNSKAFTVEQLSDFSKSAKGLKDKSGLYEYLEGARNVSADASKTGADWMSQVKQIHSQVPTAKKSIGVPQNPKLSDYFADLTSGYRFSKFRLQELDRLMKKEKPAALIRMYTDMASEVIHERPVTKKLYDSLRRMKSKTPQEDANKELAQFMLDRYTGADLAKNPALARFERAGDWLSRMGDRSVLAFSTPLQVLHVGRFFVQGIPELVDSPGPSSRGVLNAIKSPREALNRARDAGLLQQQEVPWNLKGGMEKFDTLANFFDAGNTFSKVLIHEGMREKLKAAGDPKWEKNAIAETARAEGMVTPYSSSAALRYMPKAVIRYKNWLAQYAENVSSAARDAKVKKDPKAAAKVLSYLVLGGAAEELARRTGFKLSHIGGAKLTLGSPEWQAVANEVEALTHTNKRGKYDPQLSRALAEAVRLAMPAGARVLKESKTSRGETRLKVRDPLDIINPIKEQKLRRTQYFPH